MTPDDATRQNDPSPDEGWIPELHRHTRELLDDPEFRNAHTSPRDTRPGSALPRYLRGRSPEETGPTWIKPRSLIIRRYLRRRAERARVSEFAKLNGWNYRGIRPFVLAALIEGKRSRLRAAYFRPNPTPSDYPVGEGPYYRMFRNFECFYRDGIPVAVVAFPYATEETVKTWAASNGLVANVMPAEGKYWPHRGSPRGSTITVAFTRPGTAVQWSKDGAAADFSPDSPGIVAEMDRLEAELDDSGPTHNA